MQVPRVQTVCTPKVYAGAFIKAWRLLEGSLPTKAQCGVLYAQWMVETSGRACWNWNIGNKKVTQSMIDAGVPWIDLPGTFEYVKGKRVILPDGDPGRRFRAYESLDHGMAEHLEALKKKWTTCWPFVRAGDTDGFAHALKAGKDGIEGTWDDYFTAPVEDKIDPKTGQRYPGYARIMREAFAAWLRMNAFDEAMADIVKASEAPTQPELENPPSSEPGGPASPKRIVDAQPIVRPRVPLGRDDD